MELDIRGNGEDMSLELLELHSYCILRFRVDKDICVSIRFHEQIAWRFSAFFDTEQKICYQSTLNLFHALMNQQNIKI